MLIAEIEFRGIQKFIFASPRLRDMVGANVLIGETIRRKLVALAMSHQAVPLPVPGELKCGVIEGDPLSIIDEIDRDDPAALYGKGVLSRDGGHLRVCMALEAPDEAATARARSFLVAADDLLQTDVPGLRYDLRLVSIDDHGKDRVISDGVSLGDDREVMLLASPYFAVCSATGSERATYEWPSPERVESIAASVKARREAYVRWREGKAGDVISLMDGWLRSGDSPDALETPPDLLKLCGRDYLAVIHADGNNVGNRAKAAAHLVEVNDRSGYLRREAAFEHFHHSNRVALRQAVLHALKETFKEDIGETFRPYQLLMVGGDDLLLICRAKRAMSFVTGLCRALAASGGAAPLTLGIGVAIAAPSLPFHRLVDLADDLSASAKRLFRRLEHDGHPASVVDWHIETGSWTPEIGTHRRKHDIVRYGTEACALIQRPLRVLEDQVEDAATVAPQLDRLEGLLRASKGLQGVARNKLRKMSSGLVLGRRAAEAMFADLPGDTLKALRDADKVGLTELWRSPAEGLWVTPFRDLVELSEIANLATNRIPSPVED